MSKLISQNNNLTWDQIKRGVLLNTGTHHIQEWCLISEATADIAYGFVCQTKAGVNIDLPLLKNKINQSVLKVITPNDIKQFSGSWFKLTRDQYDKITRQGLINNLQQEFEVAAPLSDFNQVRLINFLSSI